METSELERMKYLMSPDFLCAIRDTRIVSYWALKSPAKITFPNFEQKLYNSSRY